MANFKELGRKIHAFLRLPTALYNVHLKLDDLQRAVGRIELRQLRNVDSKALPDYEFSVYSQWGEDGIIQFLLQQVKISKPIFIEFGVQNYSEANTRYLLQNNFWSGLIIDASPQYIRQIKSDPIYWRHNLKADCQFVDAENINSILQNNGVSGEVGLLSIDIDGNDYWVWKAINCVSPAVVICEYNSLFGAERLVTTPYDRHFYRTTAHYSNLYFGASIAALTKLGEEKGYQLIGSNSAGNNVFFVRKDLMASLSGQTPQAAYVKAQFRESRQRDGELSFLSFEQARALIGDMPLFDIALGRNVLMKDI